MRKAASIFLRACERRRDLDSLIYWLKNPEVTRFLNEEPGVVHYLSRLADTVGAHAELPPCSGFWMLRRKCAKSLYG